MTSTSGVLISTRLSSPHGWHRSYHPTSAARALRFRFDHHRSAYVTGRGMLRLLLGHYLDSDPARLSFVPSPMGKPALAVEHNRDSIRFNVSHSNDLVLYAVTRDQEVGVDLEHVRPLADMEKIAKRFFTARECAVLKSISPEARETAFYTCWTRKEAYLKALGGGLSRSLDSFEVSLRPEEPARLLWTIDDVQEPERWSLVDLSPATGFVAALAVAGRNHQIQCYHFSPSQYAEP